MNSNKNNVIPIRKDIEQKINVKKKETIEESFDNLTKFVEDLIKGFES